MDWVTSLIYEYKAGRKQLKKQYNSMGEDDPERKITSGMIRDMEFAIEWLKTGRMPGQIKGIDQKRVYQVNSYQRKKIPYGVTGYWDNSVNAFVPKSAYNNPFEAVEERIDHEMELKQNARNNVHGGTKKAVV